MKMTFTIALLERLFTYEEDGRLLVCNANGHAMFFERMYDDS